MNDTDFFHCHSASDQFKGDLLGIFLIQIFVGDIMQLLLLLLNRSFSDGCERDLRPVNGFA